MLFIAMGFLLFLVALAIVIFTSMLVGPYIVFFHRNHPILLSIPVSLVALGFMVHLSLTSIYTNGYTLAVLSDVETLKTNTVIIKGMVVAALVPLAVFLLNTYIALKTAKKNKQRKAKHIEELVFK